jgi:hypothetical protein
MRRGVNAGFSSAVIPSLFGGVAASQNVTLSERSEVEGLSRDQFGFRTEG